MVIEDTRHGLGLIADDSDAPTSYASKAHYDIVGIILMYLEKAPLIYYAPNRLSHVIRMVWILGNQCIQDRAAFVRLHLISVYRSDVLTVLR